MFLRKDIVKPLPLTLNDLNISALDLLETRLKRSVFGNLLKILNFLSCSLWYKPLAHDDAFFQQIGSMYITSYVRNNFLKLRIELKINIMQTRFSRTPVLWSGPCKVRFLVPISCTYEKHFEDLVIDDRRSLSKFGDVM